jgi:hypothetical protein
VRTMDWILEKYHFGDFKQKVTSYKRICELIIVLFFILLYLLLKNSQIPQIEHQFTKSYRQIDWQRHIPERIKKVNRHEVPSPGTQNAETGQSSFDWAEIVDTDLLKNDVTSILNQQPQRSLLNIPDRMHSRVMTYRLPTDETDPSLLIDEQKDYLKDNATQLVPSILVEPKEIGTTVAINDIMVNQSNIGSHRIYPGREKASITDDKIIPEAGVIEIPLISREKVSKQPDISVIIDQLMLWMKKHPYEFNKVVKSFMMYEKNDLTSKVVFRYKDRVFELYLLYKEKIKEIRICLIESDQSTMLIDSGFKKQSNYLRTGSVVRLEDNMIFSFSTSQYPASEKKTSDFYQFFLSWWELAKKEK